MIPRSVRPALARNCATGLSEARLASLTTPVMGSECIPVSTSTARAETFGCYSLRSRPFQLAGFHEGGGDVSELDVLALRGLREQGKGGIGGDPVAFHQDPLGLPDDVPVEDRSAHLLGPPRVRASERGQGGGHP